MKRREENRRDRRRGKKGREDKAKLDKRGERARENNKKGTKKIEPKREKKESNKTPQTAEARPDAKTIPWHHNLPRAR